MTYWPSQNMLQLGLDFSLHISTLHNVHDPMMVSQNSNGILHLWPASRSPQGKVAFSFPVCSWRVPALAIKTYFVRTLANKTWHEFILSSFFSAVVFSLLLMNVWHKIPTYIYRYSSIMIAQAYFCPCCYSIWYDATWLRLFAYHVSYACIYLFF